MAYEPTALEQSGTATDYAILIGGTAIVCNSVPTFSTTDTCGAVVGFTVASGLTVGDACLGRSATSSAFLAWRTEL